MRYEPAPEECADLVFPVEDAAWAAVRANCVRLGVENIRILQRILRTYERFEKALGSEVELVRAWLVHSVPLLVLAHYSREEHHPSVEYVLARVSRVAGDSPAK